MEEEVQLMKKSIARILGMCMALILVLSLAAYSNPAEDEASSKDEEAAVESQESADEAESTDEAESADEAESTEETSGDDIKVALCLLGPANDGAWSSYAYNAVMAAQEVYDNLEVKYTENVKPTDMEAVFTDYASQGFDLIIGHSYSFGDAALTVAERYPDVKFAIIDGTVEADNVASYNLKTQEQGYIGGVMAVAMTKTGKVGFVAGQEGPSIIKVVEAFKLGAKAQDPEVEVLTAYTGSFDDVAKSKEAAQAMIEQGVDFIYGAGNQSNAGMIKACEEAGIYCVGELDQQSLAPKNVLMCSLSDIEGLVQVAVKQVMDGTYEGGIQQIGFADGVLSFTDYGELEDEIPQEVKDLVAETTEKITNGEIEVPRIEDITND